MEKYLAQLIEDLKALQRDPSEPWYKPSPDASAVESDLDRLDDSDDEMDFADVERYLSGDYEQKISGIFDLRPEQFPPAERLTDDQMQDLCAAYTALLSSWSIGVSIPEGIPIEVAYKTLVGTLDREAFISDTGFVTLEFCSYDPEDCPFGQWCDCGELNWGSDDKPQ